MNARVSSFFTAPLKNNPLVLIDVGAMGGYPLKWDIIADNLKIIAFEPDPREFIKLKNTDRVTYFNCALHKKQQELFYNITVGEGKSSIFEPNFELLAEFEDIERFRVIKQERIPAERVRTLDYLFGQGMIKDADFIKLDTQGSELLILEGGQSRLLPKAFGAQVETEFIEMYKGQPLFRDVDSFMSAKGFFLIDIRRLYWKRKNYYDYKGKGQLVVGDGLYFKKLDILAKELTGLGDRNLARAKLLKSIVVCLVYQTFDYAAAIAQLGPGVGCLTEPESARVIAEIKKYASSNILSRAVMHKRIFNILNSLIIKFRPFSYLGWADRDFEIGNVNDV